LTRVTLGVDNSATMNEEEPRGRSSLRAVRDRLTRAGLRSLVARTLLLAGGWWALTEGDPAGLGFGVPVVLLAVCSTLLVPSARARRWSTVGLLRFVVAFLGGSLRGGLDVARRVLSPRLPLDPAIVRYALRVPAGPARQLFIGTINLMPGTLSADLVGDELEVHVLVDTGAELVRQLEEIEAHIARALGEPLETSHA
jgi:multicomponent Na+:H+ antiporter subunit E